ncbi:hypothetical protein E4Q23_07830 [Candidatus Accumulibacter phosphatis]|uniref:Plasmid pRiA4b Orf3-like domain-containing protein n=2 Tax=Candidatus Accumulibacter phosphatis TaxID=327160 RepID=A0ABX1TTT5_9PROT|nr:hypothetical protein [Candidatus Accumulibacter phosphatis]
MSYILGIRQIALMQLFGLLDIESETAAVGRGWKIRRIAATRWGLSASATYFKAFGDSTNDMLERLFFTSVENSAAKEELSEADAELPPFYAWAKVALSSFPAWKNILGGVDAVEPFRGSMTFKVLLGQSVWRRIVMPAAGSFEDLAEFILDTFEFDDEHLYQFRYQDEYASLRMLDDPRCSDVYDDYADEVTLAEAGLFPGQVVEFRYDFGDNLLFSASSPTRSVKSLDCHVGCTFSQYAGLPRHLFIARVPCGQSRINLAPEPLGNEFLHIRLTHVVGEQLFIQIHTFDEQ